MKAKANPGRRSRADGGSVQTEADRDKALEDYGKTLAARRASRENSSEQARADGGPVNPGGKRISNDQWGQVGSAFSDEVNKQGRTKGGRPDKWPNLTSSDPKTEEHFRWMESSGAKLSAAENERAEQTGEDPREQERWTAPEDRARYHGFKRGGKSK
jgi:hypothetical protein